MELKAIERRGRLGVWIKSEDVSSRTPLYRFWYVEDKAINQTATSLSASLGA